MRQICIFVQTDDIWSQCTSVIYGGFAGAARSRPPPLANDTDLRADTIRPYGLIEHKPLIYNGFWPAGRESAPTAKQDMIRGYITASDLRADVGIGPYEWQAHAPHPILNGYGRSPSAMRTAQFMTEGQFMPQGNSCAVRRNSSRNMSPTNSALTPCKFFVNLL